MSNKNREIIQKDDVIQAIIVADNFGGEFIPITNDIPLSLLPVLNKPLIDYTLEFLSLGGVEEVFLFCCTHVEQIKAHINTSIRQAKGWTLTMKTHLIVSESCCSFGDCLRDLDAKGLVRGSFVLLEPGVLSNIKLLPIIKKHNETYKSDKGAAMTVLLQEAGIGQIGRCPNEELVIAINKKNRVLFHKKLGQSREHKVKFPLEIFLDNSNVSLRHNVKDTHIAVCSPSVLPLFSDNFDFQTKDDFIRGLLINEDILDSRIYCHIVKGSQYGGAITNWRMYQALGRDLKNCWIYPLVPTSHGKRLLKNDVIVGEHNSISNTSDLTKTVIGSNVVIGKNVKIENSFIFSNTKIDDNAIITLSIIGQNCRIKSKSKVTAGSIIGNNVIIEENLFIENSLVQSNKPEKCDKNDILGKNAYRLKVSNDGDRQVDYLLAKKFSHLHIDEFHHTEDSDDDDRHTFRDSDDELSSNSSSSSIPDDTKLFLNEVIDSLTRGFEEKLQCDNLILEINSSRYAYNVSLAEVNFNVIKALLNMSLKNSINNEYFTQLVHLLSYFEPILKNYIRNESAMMDCLKAIEDVAMNDDDITEKWVTFVVKYFYDKDHLNEEIIIEWFSILDNECKIYSHIKPFTDWLQNAEEASSTSEEDDSD